jgi:arylsulfatase A
MIDRQSTRPHVQDEPMRPIAKVGICALVLTLSAGTAARPQPGPSASRPNVVLIIMDDLGYGDLGSYGAPDARTPHIDRLARGGVRFTESYANGAVCSPTRAALLTGRYQQRVGIEWALGETARGLRVSAASLPALLKTSGYATGLVGKWHLGYRPEEQPNAHGFDEFFGFLGGIIDYYTHTDQSRRHDLYENGKAVEVPGYITDELTTRAVGFIDRHAAGPFFLEVAYNATHMPFQPPPDARGNHRATPLGERPGDPWAHTRDDYVRMLERVDDGVGKIMAALEARGVARNTLVIFTSDNGGEWLSRNEPFTNRKGTLWEGGIRVPLILYWPARLPAGRTSPQVALTMDLTASVLAAAGASAAGDYPLDGIDLVPIARGDAPVRTRDVFWRIVRPTRLQRAVRSGDWKLLIDGNPGFAGDGASTQMMLFDVRADPAERRDVAASHATVVAELRAKLAAWEREVVPPVGPALMAAARAGGAAGVVARYRVLRSDSVKTWLFDASQLNEVGYWFLEQKMPADAVTVFLLNVDEYPDAWNPYDSLGEAHLVAGDTVRAIAAYKRSVALNPRNDSGIAALRRLKATP